MQEIRRAERLGFSGKYWHSPHPTPPGVICWSATIFEVRNSYSTQYLIIIRLCSLNREYVADWKVSLFQWILQLPAKRRPTLSAASGSSVTKHFHRNTQNEWFKRFLAVLARSLSKLKERGYTGCFWSLSDVPCSPRHMLSIKGSKSIFSGSSSLPQAQKCYWTMMSAAGFEVEWNKIKENAKQQNLISL